MSRDKMRRNTPVFPMSSAIKLTDLTARQIRYYETLGLIELSRSEGNHRLFSMNDLDFLLSIKFLMEKGFTMKRIGEILEREDDYSTKEILNYQELKQSLPNRGDLSRFF